ncbi:Protoporphyrinogen oxidase [Trametes coccinea BRFM310]|uniref:Protoporphyrinogen oxidase n=1 Tax=Trametes coccinea (strain BRFM310) TaxID=1353009 RepID=A0A1Y2IVL1_TRAC3|nr:Protoporphyrinogen oxidase [Trametes coccinea BRFM310]
MGSPSVTIVGGGLSGLSAAFHLSRRFPASSGARITLVEKSNRLGGWVKSERARVKDRYGGRQADVLLESGPRTLRPASKAILELIHLLNLTTSVLTVPRTAPAARNRFLHISGARGLTKIPGSLPSLLVSPLVKILVPAILADFRRRNGRVLNTSQANDESVDAFLTRHFGSEFAQVFGSALIHGIYAADSRQLSIRAAFPAMCRLEENGKGSIVRGAISDMLSLTDTSEGLTYHVGDVAQLMKGVSVYSFRDGMQTLTDAMTNYLKQQQNVVIVKGDGAAALAKSTTGDGFQVTTESGKEIVSSHLIAAMPLPLLHRLLAHSRSMSPETSQSTSPPPGSTHNAAPLRRPSFPHPALSLKTGIRGRYMVQSHAGNSASSPSSPTTSTPSPVPLLPHLLANPSSSVTVVNIVFPPSDKPIHPDGFGYLIPRPQQGYPSPPGSTLGMLGTVFDSSALSGQDISICADHRSPKFTKVTVMLGGPYGPPSPAPASPDFLPTLLATLQEHLGHDQPLPEPCLVRVREHQDCIPTLTVGHVERMAELRAAVKEKWGENAVVIGASIDGVSVGDCIESGRRAALEL